MANYRKKCIELLESRGVSLDAICEVTYLLQKNFHKDSSIEDYLPAVMKVLNKNEVQFTIMTAIELDVMAEKRKMDDRDLEKILLRDEGLYGVDEVLAYGICNLFGSIALTNFGFVDREKLGIIAELNESGKSTGICHTFLDDVVGAIAASAAANYAHTNKRKEE